MPFSSLSLSRWRRSFNQPLGNQLLGFLLPIISLSAAAPPIALTEPQLEIADVAYVEQLLTSARTKNLAAHPRWLALGHYEQALFGAGVLSRADDPRFFASPFGQRDPNAELEATIRSFFQVPTPEELSPTDSLGRNIAYSAEFAQHPQCRFVARLQWLSEELAIAAEKLPSVPCYRFDEWRQAVDPERITLVFPAAFLNNPASMFGHTLLRLDTRGLDEKSQLLSYAANYAATTQGEGGFVYAAKGLFGGYQGHFSIMPYYDRVKKYNDLERRDIWEYQLDLTPGEIELVVKHLWELRSIYFNYFYFDENCAFHLLAVLEVARPGLGLTPQFPFWAIPGDTVRSVLKKRGLLKAVVYRPSLATALEHRLQTIEDAEFRTVRDLAHGKLSPDGAELASLPPDQRAQLLDTAFEYLQFLLISRKIEPETVAATNYNLLLARAKLPVNTNAPGAQLSVLTPAVRPDQGHESSRISFGAGSRDAKVFSEFSWRASYHDLLDPAPGYIEGAQIELFDLALRYYEKDSFEFEHFTFVDVLSLSQRGRLSSPLAWNMRAELIRTRFRDDTDIVVARASGGYGANFNLSDSLNLFAMLGPDARYSGHYADTTSIGIGPRVGLLSRTTDRLSLLADLSGARFFFGEHTTSWSAELSAHYQVELNTGIRISATRNEIFDDRFSEVVGTFLWYF